MWVYEDHTKQILATNDSPDVCFSWSVNPYRGCMHACAYCFARPTHEYLSFGAGTDFETKIAVKTNAAELLRAAFEKKSWKGECVVFSGVTDCYQPLEASYRLTRRCLEVCAEYQNPVGIITKAPLVERDLDVLQELTRRAGVNVMLSIPFWDQENARLVEPLVATPKRRLQAIETLARAGVSVGVMTAPVIPGLNDEDMVKVLTAAKNAGATSAGYVLLRLPGSLKQVFEDRIRAAFPLKAEKILHRVRETRGGGLYDSRYGVRGVGEGLYAKTIENLFDATVRRLGLRETMHVREGTFRRPERPGAQLALLGGTSEMRRARHRGRWTADDAWLLKKQLDPDGRAYAPLRPFFRLSSTGKRPSQTEKSASAKSFPSITNFSPAPERKVPFPGT